MNSLYRDLKMLVEQTEIEYMKNAEKKWRLGFHLTPPVGWLNDPNGLCYFQGEYHFFFQYSPFDANGGLKLWGHYKSKDLLKWEYLGAAMFPDQPFDCHGVYSGSAYVEDDTMHLYYTGNVKREGNYNYVTDGRDSNTIYAKCRDGIMIEEKKCILTNKDYPENMTRHIRDPKVWKENNKYFMVLGARSLDDAGQVLLYESEDKERWCFQGTLKSQNKLGYMWECPDLFQTDGQRILSVSPQGLEADGFQFQNVYQSGYMFVKGDFTENNSLKDFREWDRGFDFYAPQTFEDAKGRRILAAWMGMPDADEFYTNPTTQYGWQHALTMPREIHVLDNKVYQTPLEEMKALRTEEICFEQSIECHSIFEMLVENNSSQEQCRIEIGNGVVLEFSDHVFRMKFENDIGMGRTERCVTLKELKNLRVFADHSSLEVFLNDGEEVFTSRYYPKEDMIQVNVQCEGGNNCLWKLKSFEIN